MSLVVSTPPDRKARGLEQFHRSVFMAGGITGCPDWQADAIELFRRYDADMVLYNPRRKDFPIGDPDAAEEQIRWEHDHLRKAHAIMFWFCYDTVQPIVLYELGAWSMMPKPIFVGVHPGYQRRQDVEIQTALARPDVVVVSDLTTLVENVVEWGARSQDPNLTPR